jgi:hypothetical protein
MLLIRSEDGFAEDGGGDFRMCAWVIAKSLLDRVYVPYFPASSSKASDKYTLISTMWEHILDCIFFSELLIFSRLKISLDLPRLKRQHKIPAVRYVPCIIE